MDWETKHAKFSDESYTVSYRTEKEGTTILLADGFVKDKNGYFRKGKKCAWFENERWFLD